MIDFGCHVCAGLGAKRARLANGPARGRVHPCLRSDHPRRYEQFSSRMKRLESLSNDFAILRSDAKYFANG
jgi:hypothetical protein